MNLGSGDSSILYDQERHISHSIWLEQAYISLIIFCYRLAYGYACLQMPFYLFDNCFAGS